MRNTKGRLDGKVAIVTGAGCVGPGWGNGRAIAVRFAEEGARVFAVDIDLHAMDETLALVHEADGQMTPYACDVTDSKAIAALVATGVGIGLQLPTTLITAQQSVRREQIGTVTALTAFFRQLGGAIGVAVLSSVVLLLLRAHLPVGMQSLDGEGLGQLLDAARHGHVAAGASDAAFRQVMWLAAALSLPSLWFVTRLPDVRLNDPATPPTVGAAAER